MSKDTKSGEVVVEYEGVKLRPSGPRVPKFGEFYMCGGNVYQCNGTVDSLQPTVILEVIDVDPHECNVVQFPGASDPFLENLGGVVPRQAPASAQPPADAGSTSAATYEPIDTPEPLPTEEPNDGAAGPYKERDGILYGPNFAQDFFNAGNRTTRWAMYAPQVLDCVNAAFAAGKATNTQAEQLLRELERLIYRHKELTVEQLDALDWRAEYETLTADIAAATNYLSEGKDA